jgi:hypothetical protein
MPTTINPVSDRSGSAGSAGSAGGADSRLEIDATRARQTDKPTTPFRDVLTGGVSLLMSGAEVATHVVAGPVMAAAVHDARVGALSAMSGSGSAAGGGPIGVASTGGAPAGGIGAATAGLAAGPMAAMSTSGSMSGSMSGQPGSDMANVQAMMQDGQSSNMQLLAVQQQIQDESQRFSTVSNVMRAKFDTAKAAVSNIRA